MSCLVHLLVRKQARSFHYFALFSQMLYNFSLDLRLHDLPQSSYEAESKWKNDINRSWTHPALPKDLYRTSFLVASNGRDIVLHNQSFQKQHGLLKRFTSKTSFRRFSFSLMSLSLSNYWKTFQENLNVWRFAPTSLILQNKNMTFVYGAL